MTFKDLKKEISINAKIKGNESAKMALHDLKELYLKNSSKNFFSEEQLLSQCAYILIDRYNKSSKGLPKELSSYERKYKKAISILKNYCISYVSLDTLQKFLEKSNPKNFEEAKRLISIYYEKKVRWDDFVSAWNLLNIGEENEI